MTASELGAGMKRRAGRSKSTKKPRVVQARRSSRKVSEKSPSHDAQLRIIALERQLSEVLAQQTATSEVLNVISSSPGDLVSVFQTMLEKSIRLCEAKFGILHRYSDGAFHTTAMVGVT